MNKKEIKKVQKKIIKIFENKVQGKKPNTSQYNKKHHGKGGHWLEKKMDVKHNSNNMPDLLGFEMKNDTKSKTSFGDWNASYYIFWNEKYFPIISCKGGRERQKLERESKTEFLKIFTRKNKDGLYSWSGKPCPSKVSDGFNEFGQILVVNKDNSIAVKYSHTKDTRNEKSRIVPKKFQCENLVLAKWNADLIQQRVENKFGKLGWFKCLKDKKTGMYDSIVFGEPFDIKQFLKVVKLGHVIFDSGMKERKSKGTDRFRSMWRASNSFWNTMIVEKYP